MSGAQGVSFTARWPQLFVGLSKREVVATVRALATMQQGGIEVEYVDVKALTDVTRGTMPREEYLAWARLRARQLAAREAEG